ncbi:helicase HerA domain-containing protein [Micromonospora carbonacea]|uniref:helicase HerA domain-containing protein n=1 Tax=Micromonospora carbonacea TaxID=47853 RepID=UPI003713C78F
MDEAERTALAALRFDWAPVPDDVWRPLPFHVEGLHVPVVREVLAGVDEAASNPHGSPLGLVVQGQRGSGKTHLLGVVRQRVQEAGGYFFLVGLLDAGSFWDNVLAALLDGLARPVPGSPETQLKLLLRRLSALVGAPRTARRAVMGDTELTRPALDAFLTGLGDYDRHAARTCQETARALALAASEDISHRDLAENYFLSGEEVVAGERAAWGMRRAPRPAQQIVQDLSWLLALTGPSVVAIDQVDTLIAQLAIESDPAVVGAAAMSPAQSLMLARMADGLMSLRQATRRTLTVLACIPNSWTIIRSTAADTVADRFRETPVLRRIDDADLARAIIEKRFSVRYGEVGYAPPYPSWPVSPRAFAEAGAFTPRQLLIEIDRHIRGCLAAGEVREMTTLGEPAAAEPRAPRPAAPVTATAEEMDRYDVRFAELRAAADVATPLGRATEDEAMPPLLAAGLTVWILERGDAGAAFSVDPPPSTDPPLHARLRLTLDERTEDQAHWCFRAISDDHHGNAALARLRKASVAAALDTGSAKRTLFLLRNRGWSTSAATRKAVAAFTAAGGQTIGVGEEDLRILSALRVMLAEATMDFQGWLADRRPTRDLKFLQHALADVDRWTTDAEPPPGPAAGPATPIPNGPIPTVAAPTVAAQATPAQAAPAQAAPVQATPVQAAPVQAAPVQAAPAPAAAVPAEPAFVVGYGYDDDAPVPLALEALRKHTTIFAGSGSGKTVLIRRIVEECALAGVSAIVLDPNNDLARLGEEWPEPPAGWRPGDAARAKDYLAYTDVVVWTPRRNSGRPLSFQPLPDFTGVRDDPDEFGEAVEAAVAALAPRAMVTGRATRAHLGLAVLRKAVEHYGRRGGSRLKGLVDTLTDLPDGIIDLDDADKIGLSLAQNLTAAMVNDPLFGGEGTPMDPGVLLTPAPGRRARVSVVSLVGLPSDDVRQSFVNQLQMALFAWIKRNPAGDRPLLGLLVMDEAQTFAPSGAMTACTQSTLALAAQARKYGLGLVFATQAPKGLHNRIPGNAATQLYGLMNSPIQIEAAREMARAKGGDVPDISRLTVGEFYLAAEGAAPRKIRTPLSLTHHPRSPLTVEEVLGRARARAGS